MRRWIGLICAALALLGSACATPGGETERSDRPNPYGTMRGGGGGY